MIRSDFRASKNETSSSVENGLEAINEDPEDSCSQDGNTAVDLLITSIRFRVKSASRVKPTLTIRFVEVRQNIS